ncbi:MAG: carbohydrate ABC transporter permease [Armatimonadetes bacterium]|nr:carbohydrate ABC transporter permease [Armatimonadota bacterium]
MKSNRLEKAVFFTVLSLFLLVILFPFYWQFVTSIKSDEEIWKIPPSLFPQVTYWDNYVRIFKLHNFARYLWNSAMVASLTTIFSLIVGAFSAYALAKLKFRGKHLILSLVLSVSMFPPIAIAPSLFMTLKQMHMINTYWALILPYTTFALPLALWNLTAFFRQLPNELQEAARVDGCSFFQTFWKILLPLTAPGLFTTGILVFIAAWNEFLFALTFTTEDRMRTVPVGIALFPGEYTAPWGQIAAASVVVTIPLVLLVLAFQRRIVAGLTAGAVKG